jgi:hypothetical protein
MAPKKKGKDAGKKDAKKDAAQGDAPKGIPNPPKGGELPEVKARAGLLALDTKGVPYGDLAAHDTTGVTCLHEAAASGLLGVVEQLLDRKADVQAADSDGWTALMCAAAAGQYACVLSLLRRGADVSKADKYGVTAPALAQRLGYIHIMEALAHPVRDRAYT